MNYIKKRERKLFTIISINNNNNNFINDSKTSDCNFISRGIKMQWKLRRPSFLNMKIREIDEYS
jgi:hypothetical protein